MIIFIKNILRFDGIILFFLICVLYYIDGLDFFLVLFIECPIFF